MKIVVADANLIPHRERFESALPDAHVCWQGSGVSPAELRDADVYVGSRFTAAMADAAEKLKLITSPGTLHARRRPYWIRRLRAHRSARVEPVPRLRLHGRSGRRGRVALPMPALPWTGDSGESDRLLRECDIAVVSAPLNEHTDGMIGARQLQGLGPDGVLINVGRGLLVQERALYEALSGGVIRAASMTSSPISGGCSAASRCAMSCTAAEPVGVN